MMDIPSKLDFFVNKRRFHENENQTNLLSFVVNEQQKTKGQKYFERNISSAF
jgi:hypothetical protein